jgi:uncharacterized phage-associated protein
MSNSFTSQQINKLGNALIYLANNVGDFNKTKILKLLFLLEESAIKKYAHPFFGFDFQLWKFGPVLNDVFIDLSEENITLLNGYIKRTAANKDEFESAALFNDDEFSDNDILLMDMIIKFAKNKTAKDLVNHTHSEKSLWRQSAISSGVLEMLETQKTSSTKYLIDFSLLFEEDSYMRERFNSSIENMHFINSLKN